MLGIDAEYSMSCMVQHCIHRMDPGDFVLKAGNRVKTRHVAAKLAIPVKTHIDFNNHTKANSQHTIKMETFILVLLGLGGVIVTIGALSLIMIGVDKNQPVSRV
ncbi:hypothetical protein WAI453_010835 [Rhynchosporium graminicola]